MIQHVQRLASFANLWIQSFGHRSVRILIATQNADALNHNKTMAKDCYKACLYINIIFESSYLMLSF